MNNRATELRTQILDLVAEFHREQFPEKSFVAGQSIVPVSGKVLDANDMRHLVDSSLDFWLTTGRFALQFEKQFARFFGVRSASLVNSGSSATPHLVNPDAFKYFSCRSRSAGFFSISFRRVLSSSGSAVFSALG